MHQFFFAQHRELLHLLNDRADVTHRFDDVAGARFALGADHGSAFRNAPQRFAEITRAADERHFEIAFGDVVLFVGGRQHFAFVDVIHAERFENARFHEMADAGLGHDGDGNGRHDLADLADGRHAGDAAFLADVGGNALERHDGGRAGLFGDHGLLGVDDVHDHAALHHLRQPDFQPELLVF